VYDQGAEVGLSGDEEVTVYVPNSPGNPGAGFAGPQTIVAAGEIEGPYAIGVNRGNDHLFVASKYVIEFDSLANGSAIVNGKFASGIGAASGSRDIAVDGANGNVYLADNTTFTIVNAAGTKVLARISGAGSPAGVGKWDRVAVDESNGHALVFSAGRETLEEFEPTGAFVGEFGSFVNAVKGSAIAVDNSGGPNDGDVYLAYFDNLYAFGPLSYGEPPIVRSGLASAVGAGSATIAGTVDPRGFDLEECAFEYLGDAEYQANIENAEEAGHESAAKEGYGFAGAAGEPCAESLAAIGNGSGAVSVHADLAGLDPEGRYRFRLLAENQFGAAEGEPGVFGPPVLTTRSAQPIRYGEATLRAGLDPSGLASKYRFDYIDRQRFEEQGGFEGPGTRHSAEAELAPSAGPTEVAVPLFGLAEGTEYRFRVTLANEVKAVTGPDQSLTTLARPAPQECENEALRAGASAGLPDCRAYELVTPADTHGLLIGAWPGPGDNNFFNNWLTVPRGAGVGERLSYFADGTLPGFDGTGQFDLYLARRTSTGWQTELAGPSYVQTGGAGQTPRGTSSDQEHSLWGISSDESFEGALPAGEYLRGPGGFELLGRGSLDTDPDAEEWYLSGAKAIFSSRAKLEPGAPPPGVEALYERTAGSPSAQVVSVPPEGASAETGEEFETLDARYVYATEDGSAIAFQVGNRLYLRRQGETIPAVASPYTFAGISADGERVFYVNGSVSGEGVPQAADLYVFDAGTQSSTQIAAEARFVNVSADGSHVYFEKEEGAEHKLYLWERGSEEARFIATLAPQDVEGGFELNDNVVDWLTTVGPGRPGLGRARSVTRSTPDGEVLVFASHGSLTPYDSEGHVEIYRYDAGAQSGAGELRCISCDPSGEPPTGEATLQALRDDGITEFTTVIPNVTEDGGKVFFETADALLPEDANSAQDVYEWKADGAGDCRRQAGCLALISSGQGERDNYLYSMSADGHDVFFNTLEKLLGADLTGSASLYDARVGGGFPEPPAAAPCQGDACQGSGSTPSALPTPASASGGGGNLERRARRCAKGKHRVKGRCRARRRHRHRKHRHHRKHRANHHRRTGR
jgi:hypothetical protein